MKFKDYLQIIMFFLLLFFIAGSLGSCSAVHKTTSYKVNACPNWTAKR